MIAASILLLAVASGCGKTYNVTDMTQPELEEAAQAAFRAEKYREAEDLYMGLMYRFPGAAHTDRYLYRLSVSQLELGLWADAEFGLRRLVRDFPRSALADDAQLALARLFWAQHRDYRKDTTPVEQAMSELAAFYDRYPGSDLAGRAESLRLKIYDLLARRALFIGRFYARRNRHDAALLYLNEAMSRFAETRWKAEILIEMAKSNYAQGNEFSAGRLYRRALDECELTPEQRRAVEEGLDRVR